MIPRIRTTSLAALSGLVTVGLVWVGSPAAVSVPVNPACPPAFTVAELVDDQPVNGLTVASGTTPAAFTGSLVGVMEDGIAPGIDMILVDLTSPDIDAVGGIWSGMSGSPVYAADGRLIGAVAYGLSAGPSPIAGVTPAEAMYALLDNPAAPARSIPRALAREMVASGRATRAQVDSGMARLPLPLGVRGLASGRFAQIVDRFKVTDVHPFSLTGAGSDATVSDIVPGGNLGVSLGYGDLTAAGIGTVTAVCATEVLGFGHPLNWIGPSSYFLHPASAVYVQADSTFSPFKVANLGAPVGVVEQDRMAAVHGLTGALPESTYVRTSITEGLGAPRVGESWVASLNDLSWMAPTAQLVGSDSVHDGINAGSAAVLTTITGETAGGALFTVTHEDRFASPWDITFESTVDGYDLIGQLVSNAFTDLTISEVSVESTLSTEYRYFRPRNVERLVHGVWTHIDNYSLLKARPGSTIRLRVTLGSYRDRYGDLQFTMGMLVPQALAPGTNGFISLDAGSNMIGMQPSAATFDELVADLNDRASRDEIWSALRWDGKRTYNTSWRTDLDEFVQIARYYRVRVVS
jgi:hypothetical protein